MGGQQSVVQEKDGLYDAPNDNLSIHNWAEGRSDDLDWTSLNEVSYERHDYFKNHPRTALHLLAFNGDLEKARFLCLKGARLNPLLKVPDINAEDEDEDYEDEDEDEDDNSMVTPFLVAIDKANLDVARCLAYFGADINRRLDCHVASPLMFATQRDDLDSIRMLLAEGARVNVRNDVNSDSCLKTVESAEAATLLLAFGCNPLVRSSVNWTVLNFIPVSNSTLEKAQVLVANGANPRARDSDTKKTPRFTAFLSDDIAHFYRKAEKYWKRLEERRLGLPTTTHLSNYDLAEIKSLEETLLEHRLTDSRILALKQEVSIHSLRHIRSVKAKKVVHAVIRVIGGLPDDMSGFIAEFCGYWDKRCWGDEFGFYHDSHMRWNEEEEDDHDNWSIVSDACTENNFGGEPFTETVFEEEDKPCIIA